MVPDAGQADLADDGQLVSRTVAVLVPAEPFVFLSTSTDSLKTRSIRSVELPWCCRDVDRKAKQLSNLTN
jgi:hypothetical protein